MLPLLPFSSASGLRRLLIHILQCLGLGSSETHAAAHTRLQRVLLVARRQHGCSVGLRVGVQVCRALALASWASPLASAIAFVTSCCSVIVLAPDGRILCNFKPYPSSSGLGVTSVSWSPTSQFLAVGCHNSRMYVLNTLTFKPTWETNHDGSSSSSTVTYRCIDIFI